MPFQRPPHPRPGRLRRVCESRQMRHYIIATGEPFDGFSNHLHLAAQVLKGRRGRRCFLDIQAATLSQVGPVDGWVCVAFSIAGPRNHEQRGVSGRRSR